MSELRPEQSDGKSATVIVKGEAASEKDAKPKAAGDNKPPRQVAPEKAQLLRQLPALNDDSAVGVSKEQIVTRDGKADLAFTGSLLASAAPASAPNGKWQELRIYETAGGKYVFSRVSRSIYADDDDAHEAEIFEPSPTSMPSQLLRSARDFARSEPLTWTDAAANFFGYEPLAKALYRKLSDRFEEHIS